MSINAFRQNYFAWGHDFAFQEFKKAHPDTFVQYQHLDIQENDIGLLDGVKRAEALQCSALIGMNLSREVALVAKTLKSKNIFLMSPTASMDRLNEFQSFFKSTSLPASEYGRKTVDFLQRKYPNHRVFLVEVEEDLISDYFTKFFLKGLRTLPRHIIIKKGERFSEKDFSEIVNTPHAAVLMTALALPSLTAYRQLIGHGFGKSQDPIIVGHYGWGLDSSALQYPAELNTTKVQIFYPMLVEVNSQKLARFSETLAKIHKHPPHIDVALGFDSTSALIECLDSLYRKHSAIFPRTISECLASRTHSGITGNFTFNNHSSFAQRSLGIEELKHESIRE